LGTPLTVDHEPAVIGDARKTGADTSRAREDLGYSPEIPLEEGLRRQVDAERERRSVAAGQSAE
jgi:nucleoside-diphosphate-sugar epimerase